MSRGRSVFVSAVYSLFIATVSSLVFSSLFGKFYLSIFKPGTTCGLSGLGCSDILGVIQNSIFAYLFFLPLFIGLLVSRRQWLVWLILIFIPFTMVLVGGSKHLFWFIVFTVAGGLIGWLVKIAIKKVKSINIEKG